VTATEPDRLSPDELRTTLRTWFHERRTTEVTLHENTPGANDDSDRYTVRYEASFEPRALDQARVEVWGTDDGQVAIGFELYARVASRVGGRRRYAKRFVGGHEPCPLGRAGLLAILDAIAGGELAVTVLALPWLGVVSARAGAAPEVVASLRAQGYAWGRWIAPIQPDPVVGRVLRFRGWT
jgi:hypothetical protein